MKWFKRFTFFFIVGIIISFSLRWAFNSYNDYKIDKEYQLMLSLEESLKDEDEVLLKNRFINGATIVIEDAIKYIKTNKVLNENSAKENIIQAIKSLAVMHFYMNTTDKTLSEHKAFAIDSNIVLYQLYTDIISLTAEAVIFN